MDLRALIIIGPLFLFICYLLELAYYKGKKDTIIKAKKLLEEETNDQVG